MDTTIFKPGEKYNSIREEFGLNENFVIMYAGAHGLANNLEIVIESARILKNYPDIVFVLVGDGKEKLRLIELKNGYGLENILFIDAQPKKRMPEFCLAADVCLAILKKLSSFKLVYPNKLFDYMASGRPTILAVDGVARKLLEKGQGGIFVKPQSPKMLADAVLKLYKDRKLVEKYGRNARKYVASYFERKKIAEDLYLALIKVVQGK